MGTHPIFESDFDCLSNRREMNRLFVNRLASRVASRPLIAPSRTLLARAQPIKKAVTRKLALVVPCAMMLFVTADVFSMLLGSELLGLWMQQWFQGFIAVTALALGIMQASVAVAVVFHP